MPAGWTIQNPFQNSEYLNNNTGTPENHHFFIAFDIIDMLLSVCDAKNWLSEGCGQKLISYPQMYTRYLTGVEERELEGWVFASDQSTPPPKLKLLVDNFNIAETLLNTRRLPSQDL